MTHLLTFLAYWLAPRRRTCATCGVWRIDGRYVVCPVKRARTLPATLRRLPACERYTEARDALNPGWEAAPVEPWPWIVAEAPASHQTAPALRSAAEMSRATDMT